MENLFSTNLLESRKYEIHLADFSVGPLLEILFANREVGAIKIGCFSSVGSQNQP